MQRCLRLHRYTSLAVFGVLLSTQAWAEPLRDPLLTGPGSSGESRVALAAETETLAARTLARTDASRVERAGRGVPVRPEEGFRAGSWHLGAMGGYAISHRIFAGRDADVEFAPLLLQVGYTITDVHGPFPVRGSLELVFEPIILVTTSPETEVGGGASLLARYNFVTGTRWVPFFDVGLGILHWPLEIPRVQASGFNFTVQGGPGLHYFVTNRLAVTGQVRLHHISNADIEKPNVGVNSSVYLLGVSYFF